MLFLLLLIVHIFYSCFYISPQLRKGVPPLNIFGFEDLLYDYGVDLAIWAHEHSYERMWPVYDRKVSVHYFNK